LTFAITFFWLRLPFPYFVAYIHSYNFILN